MKDQSNTRPPALFPLYRPPDVRSACSAAGMAPLLVLVTFTLLITKWISVACAASVGVTTTLWLIYEMTRYQHLVDSFPFAFAGRHLRGRSDALLRAFVAETANDEDTRIFIDRYLDAGCRVLRDGQQAR